MYTRYFVTCVVPFFSSSTLIGASLSQRLSLRAAAMVMGSTLPSSWFS